MMRKILYSCVKDKQCITFKNLRLALRFVKHNTDYSLVLTANTSQVVLKHSRQNSLTYYSGSTLVSRKMIKRIAEYLGLEFKDFIYGLSKYQQRKVHKKLALKFNMKTPDQQFEYIYRKSNIQHRMDNEMATSEYSLYYCCNQLVKVLLGLNFVIHPLVYSRMETLKDFSR